MNINFTIREMLESGVHFGHKPQRWNPAMSPYIYGTRNGVHIFDLTKTATKLNEALNVISETSTRGDKILFVGTKPQAQKLIEEYALKSDQYYINKRWLGGTMTNWKTINNSIQELERLEKILKKENEGFTKKELLKIERKFNELKANLGGIRAMGTLPQLIIIIDIKKEKIAVEEAKKLGIPIVAVVDSNCQPEGIDYVIPGNDDATRSITFFLDLFRRAVISGMSVKLAKAGINIDEFSSVTDAESIKKKLKEKEDEAKAKAEAEEKSKQDALLKEKKQAIKEAMKGAKPATKQDAKTNDVTPLEKEEKTALTDRENTEETKMDTAKDSAKQIDNNKDG